MGLGPRRGDRDMRSKQGKIVPVFTLPKSDVLKANCPADSGGGGIPNKQHTSPKVKNSSPNYPQRETSGNPIIK